MIIGGLIPVSDSGEAEGNLVFGHQRFSLIRGFSPASCPEGTTMWRKNHLQESRAFWLLFCGKKVTGEIKLMNYEF